MCGYVSETSQQHTGSLSHRAVPLWPSVSRGWCCAESVPLESVCACPACSAAEGNDRAASGTLLVHSECAEEICKIKQSIHMRSYTQLRGVTGCEIISFRISWVLSLKIDMRYTVLHANSAGSKNQQNFCYVTIYANTYVLKDNGH